MEQSTLKPYQHPDLRVCQLAGQIVCISADSRETEASDMNYETGSWFEE